MTTPKRWTELVRDAKRHDISDWHPGGITSTVREADEAWTTQVEAQDAELIKYIDLYIFMERDRDQCARERDAYKAERDALLRLARAAHEWEEAQRVYTGLFESSAYEGGMGGAERRLDRAEDELRAALAALDAAGEGE